MPPSTPQPTILGTLTPELSLGRRLLVPLTDARILWAVAAVFALRDLFFWLLPNPRPDTSAFLAGAALYLRDPVHMYDATIAWVARTGTLPLPGAQGITLQPPTVIALAMPFTAPPRPAGLALWALADAAAMIGALVLLYRVLHPAGPGRPLYWLLAAYFPPLFAEVDAGQVGGFVLLLAVASVAVGRARPALGGFFGGLSSALRFYPAALVLGIGPRRGRTYIPALALTALAAELAAFAPIGLPQGLWHYVTGALLPAQHARLQDCAIVSVPTLFKRVVGGDPYAYIGGSGLQVIRLPLHLPTLASGLTYLAIAGLVAATIWAAWKSDWHPLYGPLLGFSLGALVPSEVNPYQLLPLLPVMLLVAVRALDSGRGWVILALAVGLLLFVKQPCSTPVPNLWTLGGLVIFGACASQARLFAPFPGKSPT